MALSLSQHYFYNKFIMRINPSTFIFSGFLFAWSLFSSPFIFAEEGVEYQFVFAWGSLGSVDGQFNQPQGIAIAPDGSVYIADSVNHRIQQFSSQGGFIRTLGGKGSDNGLFHNPRDIAIASDGSIYIADRNNSRIQHLSANGDFIRTWGTQGHDEGRFGLLEGIAIAANGDIYAVDSRAHLILQFSSQGDFIRSWGGFGSDDGLFKSPAGIAIAINGDVYVTDRINYRIQQFNAEGDFIRSWGIRSSDDNVRPISSNVIAIEIASDGSIYIADAGTSENIIQQFNAQGDFIRAWGSEGSSDGQFSRPYGIAIAPDGDFYVTNSNNNRIQKFEPKNKTTTTLTYSSIGSFAEPSDTPEQAVPILVNDEPQYHLLDDADDQDWFEFYAEQGIRYTIILPQVSIGSAIDPIITLFDETGIELEQVNSSPLGQEEQLNWTATATALFRIRVSNGTSIKSKAKPLALEYAYTINIFLSDAPQQGIIKGLVSDSCQQLGLGKVVITAALSGQITESTFTHKTGEYGIPINPGDYDLNTQIENYQNSQKNVTVQQVTASQAPFSLAPVTDCSQMSVRVADPTLLAQQAVANYNDQTGQLIIKDVGANGQSYYAELQDQGGYHFALTNTIELTGSIHSNPASYSFETLLVDMSTVFAFNTIYKVQMKNDGNFLFSLTEATKP